MTSNNILFLFSCSCRLALESQTNRILHWSYWYVHVSLCCSSAWSCLPFLMRDSKVLNCSWVCHNCNWCCWYSGWTIERNMWERHRAYHSSIRVASREDWGGQVFFSWIRPVQSIACPRLLPLPRRSRQPTQRATLWSSEPWRRNPSFYAMYFPTLPFILLTTCPCILQKQADVNTGLLLLGALCHILLLMFRYAVNTGEQAVDAAPTLALSRACSMIMLLAYVAYLFFQLKTHRQLFESQEVRHRAHRKLTSSHASHMTYLCKFIRAGGWRWRWWCGIWRWASHRICKRIVMAGGDDSGDRNAIRVRCWHHWGMHFDPSTITHEAIMLN